MIRKLNESVDDIYYIVTYGGQWNHGQKKCISEYELKQFLDNNIFDGTVTIIKCENVTNKYSDSIDHSGNYVRSDFTDVGNKQLFDRGITSADNLV